MRHCFWVDSAFVDEQKEQPGRIIPGNNRSCEKGHLALFLNRMWETTCSPWYERKGLQYSSKLSYTCCFHFNLLKLGSFMSGTDVKHIESWGRSGGNHPCSSKRSWGTSHAASVGIKLLRSGFSVGSKTSTEVKIRTRTNNRFCSRKVTDPLLVFFISCILSEIHSCFSAD